MLLSLHALTFISPLILTFAKKIYGLRTIPRARFVASCGHLLVSAPTAKIILIFDHFQGATERKQTIEDKRILTYRTGCYHCGK